MTFKVLTLALATICLPAGVVLAQNADQGNQATQGSNAGAAGDQSTNAAAATDQTAQSNSAAAPQLQEVVVTAERRATNLQTTPISITAIQGTQLQSLHITTVDSLQTVVPSLVDLNMGNEYELMNIRGIGDSFVATDNATGTAVTFDGTEITATIGVNPPMFDIADVEVLEGPQGTLFGASAIAGAIEITSANPNFNGVNGYVQMDLGNYSDKHVQGAVNLPVSDTFAVRLAYNFEQENSFYRDIGSGDDGYFINAAGAEVPSYGGSSGVLGYELDPGENNDESARLSFLWKPTDNFQALGKFTYNYINLDGLATEPNNIPYTTLFSASPTANPTSYAGCHTQPASINFPGAVGNQQICPGAGATTVNEYAYPGEKPFVLDYYLAGGAPSYIQNQDAYNLNLSYTFPDQIQLRSMSSITEVTLLRDNDNCYCALNTGWAHVIAGPHESYKQEELDLVSPTSGNTNWIVGGFFEYRDTPIWNHSVTVGAPFQPNELPATETFLELGGVLRQSAIFGQFNWQFARTLQFQLGARENWDSNYGGSVLAEAPPRGTILPQPAGTGAYTINYPTGCSAAAGTCVPTSYTVASPISEAGPAFYDRVPTGKANLSWTPLPGQNFYLFYARGYVSGTANEGSTDHPFVNPETLNDWELGWKGRLLDGHMVTQVGFYYYDLQNFQWTAYDTEATSDEGTGSYIANLGPTKLYGVELSEQARFGGFGVNAGFSYDKSKLGALTEVNSNDLPSGWGSPLSIPQCLSGHNYTGAGCFNYSPYEQTVSGEQIPESPLYTFNAQVDYNFPVANGVIDPRVTYSYTASQYSDVFQDAYTYVGPRHLVGATCDFIFGKWDTQLYGTNLTNQIYLVSNQMTDLNWGNPRQYGIQLTYKF